MGEHGRQAWRAAAQADHLHRGIGGHVRRLAAAVAAPAGTCKRIVVAGTM